MIDDHVEAQNVYWLIQFLSKSQPDFLYRQDFSKLYMEGEGTSQTYE